MRVRYTPRALTDLQLIQSYIARHNPSSAARVFGVVESRVDGLRNFPEAGYRSDEPDIRILLAIPYPYRIYYRIAGDEVESLHIRHTSRRRPATGEL